jgi:hypothetical protein
MLIFTSICANYLHKATVLANSIKRNIPDACFVVCLLEREIPTAANCPNFDRVVLAKDAWEGNFDRFIFKHTIVEASTAVKGQFFRFLFKEYPDETMFIYLDPDIMVYADFPELRELLKNHPIILCPHLLQPGNIDMELSSTAHGVYNLGFLAVNRSEESRRFIDWWAERLYLFCYNDMVNGVFTDQKWVDLAPCFFDVHILKHRGYDFGPWSLLDAGMYEENGQVYIQGDPLRFIHFSGYGESIDKCIREWLPENPHPFRSLYTEYSADHDETDKDQFSAISWSYDYYFSGQKINSKVRLKYRKDYDLMFSIENPFEFSNRWFSIRTTIYPFRFIELIQKSIDIIERQGWSIFWNKVKTRLKFS